MTGIAGFPNVAEVPANRSGPVKLPARTTLSSRKKKRILIIIASRITLQHGGQTRHTAGPPEDYRSIGILPPGMAIATVILENH
jgi:hypothetical protein